MTGWRKHEPALCLVMMGFSLAAFVFFWLVSDRSVTPYTAMFIGFMAMWRIALLEQRLADQAAKSSTASPLVTRD